MSKDLNKVQIIGRLGKDPELRFTPQGTPVANFTVAAGRQWKDPNGEQREETEWFPIVVWNNLAEICNQYLTKGSRVYIEGRLQTRSWDDENGQKRFKTEVIANDMIILDKANGGGNDSGDGGDYEEAVVAQNNARATQPAQRQAANTQGRQNNNGGQRQGNNQGGQFLNNQQANRTNQRQQPARQPVVQDDDDLPF